MSNVIDFNFKSSSSYSPLPSQLDPLATSRFYGIVGDPLQTEGYPTSEPIRELWGKVSDVHDPKAMVALAVTYILGRQGVSKDFSLAIDLLNRAAELNDKIAIIFQLWVALAAQPGASLWTAAVQRVQKAAESQNPEAMYTLGMIYEYCCDECGEISFEQKNELFSTSAALGNSLATLEMGEMALINDPSMSGELYQAAINNGNVHGYFRLYLLAVGRLSGDEKVDRIKWQWGIRYLQEGANAGDFACMSALAEKCFSGVHEELCPKDVFKAYTLWSNCAEYDDPFSLNGLGDYYAQIGENAAAIKCYKSAIALFQKSYSLSDLGRFNKLKSGKVCGKSMRMISTKYRNGGNGVLRSFQLALEWLKKAAEMGDDESIAELRDRLQTGDGMVQDRREAFRWNLYRNNGRCQTGEGII